MITENDKRLAKRIQKLRKQTGMTQEEFAAKVRLSSKYIQFIETAHRILMGTRYTDTVFLRQSYEFRGKTVVYARYCQGDQG